MLKSCESRAEGVVGEISVGDVFENADDEPYFSLFGAESIGFFILEHGFKHCKSS